MQTFSDIAGVIADDIMIIAASDEIEHDEIVPKVTQRARDKYIRFNKGKIQFNVSSLTYMGHIAGADLWDQCRSSKGRGDRGIAQSIMQG